MYIGRNIIKLLALFYLTFISLSSNAAFVAAQKADNVAYFLFAAPNKIVRYDLENETLLDEISLEKVPTSFMVTGESAYVGFHRELSKVDFTNDSHSFIRNLGSDISAISVLNDVIYLREQSTSNISVLNESTYELIETYSGFYSGNILLRSDIQNAIYYRSLGVSPSDIHKLTLSETGTISTDKDSPYHGDYPSASTLYINESENKIYDNAGIVYFASDLTYAGSLGGTVEGMTFIGDNVIALRDNALTLYNSSGIEQGMTELTSTPNELFSFGSNVFGFTTTDSGVSVEKTDLSEFSLPSIGAAIDPVGLAYLPELIDSDGSDVIYLYDEESLSIFRWSTVDKKYLTSWTLTNPVNWLTVSTDHKRVYLGYSDGKITYFSTDVDNATQTHFSTLATSVHGLLAAGKHLFAADNSGAWNTHYSLGIDGSTIDSVDWRKISYTYVWNEHNGKIYHYRNGTSPNDIEWTHLDNDSGTFGNNGDSPYHGSDLSTSGMLYIINDNQLLLNGAGQILDVESLSIVNNLSNPVSDAVWINNQLITFSDNYALQLWGDNYEKEFEFSMKSEAGKLLNINDKLNLVLYKQSGPEFLSYDLANLPDTDNDGKHDLLDNCIDVKNEDQLDNDDDSFGDVCDNDDDNDSLTDALEISLGLNPKSSADAALDLDEDGFSNLIESLLGSELDNANSTPTQIKYFEEKFEEQWPLGFQSVSGSLPWTLSTNGVDNSGALTSTFFKDENQSSRITFTSYFSDGVLAFDYKTTGNYINRYGFQVYVDGEQYTSLYLSSSSTTWSNSSISLSAGVHQIEFVISADYVYGNESKSTLSIDNVSFSADADLDGISDLIDNCPDVSNRWQYDRDEDGLGDSCDKDPYNNDTDGDGWGDERDNCPDIANPEQENIDDDYYGDACDDSDDRPADTDNDGIFDYYDNCIDISNPEQADFDYDWIGDACDTDIDNDGVSNYEEDKYSFMNNFDAEDINGDYDNDGVANILEINSGFSPEIANEYPQISLIDYFPVGDIDYLYLDDYQYKQVKMVALANSSSFEISIQIAEVETIEIRDAGIYLTKGSYYGDTYSYSNFLIFPAAMSLGEIIESNSLSSTSLEQLANTGTVEKITHQLVKTGITNWKGDDYESITLKSSYSDDGNVYYSQNRTYLKGVGLVELDGMKLDSYSIAEVEQPAGLISEEDKDNTNSENDNVDTEDESGGSFAIFPLIMILLIIIRRKL